MRFLKLASNLFAVNLPANPEPGPDRKEFVVPFAVDVSATGRMVAFSEGAGHGGAGGAFSLQEALDPSWNGQFDAARGQWLLPYLRRLADGDTVTETELTDHFVTLHGRKPESYEWDISPR